MRLSLAFLTGVLAMSLAQAALSRPLPPPPPIPIPPSAMTFSTYPLEVFGDPPGAAGRSTAVDAHYHYAPGAPGFLAYINATADCRPTDPEIRIFKPPSNGSLKTERAPPPSDVFSGFWNNPGDPRHGCDARKVQALWLTYSPSPGFHGVDLVLVDIKDGAKLYRTAISIKVD